MIPKMPSNSAATFQLYCRRRLRRRLTPTSYPPSQRKRTCCNLRQKPLLDSLEPKEPTPPRGSLYRVMLALAFRGYITSARLLRGSLGGFCGLSEGV